MTATNPMRQRHPTGGWRYAYIDRLRFAKLQFGTSSIGFIAFAGLCLIAMTGLTIVKTRWRTTWDAVSDARI